MDATRWASPLVQPQDGDSAPRFLNANRTFRRCTFGEDRIGNEWAAMSIRIDQSQLHLLPDWVHASNLDIQYLKTDLSQNYHRSLKRPRGKIKFPSLTMKANVGRGSSPYSHQHTLFLSLCWMLVCLCPDYSVRAPPCGLKYQPVYMVLL